MTTAPSASDTSRQFLPALILLFVGSGCAALIYEVVWFQLLQLVIGSSAVSLGVLLGTFMGGMCLGSFLLPRRIDPTHHPLKVYAFLEFGIGAMGLLLLWGMPLIGGAYTAWAGGSIIVRSIVAAICLLPPTLMMGATLPAVARWVQTTPQGVSWLGFFYGGNIAGAVVGSLLAGFYLLRIHDMAFATYTAVALNVIVATIGLLIAKVTTHEPVAEEKGDIRRAAGATAVYVTIALSGMTALSAEVLWTRLLSLLFGATVYTFSLILAVFLLGLGIGSTVGSALSRDARNPRAALGWCQMAICGALGWAAYQLNSSLPYWPINPSLTPAVLNSTIFNFQLDVVRCMWVVLPGAILWGASFPLALAAVAAPGQDPGRLVGGVYAANTVGAIVGALGTGLALVILTGTQTAQQILIVVSALSALIMLAPIAAGEGTPAAGPKRLAWIGTIFLVLATGAAGLLARSVPPVPGLLVAYGRYSATWINQSSIIYVGEGLNAFVAVSQLSTGVRNYHNAGKVQASSEPQDMRLQRMLGHLTHLIPNAPKKTLVIGCGAGVTAGAVSIGPNVEHVTIAEIEPLVPEVVSTYFAEHNYDVVNSKKVRIHLDDARHYLMTTDEKFDAITSDPLDPWVKGAANLYTQEFFEVAKAHLNPGGVVTLFVQLYESNTAAVKSEIGTFFKAFPNGVVWGNTNNGVGYDLVIMGQAEPIKINIDQMESKLQSPAYGQVMQSLREIGFNSAIELFSTYAGTAQDLEPWLKDASINRDRNLRLQYLAGMGLNLYQSGPIYSDMLAYAGRFPDNIFTGSDASMQALRDGIQRAQGR